MTSRCSCSGSYSSRPLVLFKLFVLACLVVGTAAKSHAQDKVELFGGYSYFRAEIREGQFNACTTNCPILTHPTLHANLNGWEFSAQYKLLPFFGGVVDFNGTYGKLDGAGTREHTYLVGPQISLPLKVSPFAHALFGVVRESQDALPAACPANTTTTCRFSLGSDMSWATALGAGIDLDVAPFVAVRLLQIDYVHTRLHGGKQNQPRVAAGIVFHF